MSETKRLEVVRSTNTFLAKAPLRWVTEFHRVDALPGIGHHVYIQADPRPGTTTLFCLPPGAHRTPSGFHEERDYLFVNMSAKPNLVNPTRYSPCKHHSDSSQCQLSNEYKPRRRNLAKPRVTMRTLSLLVLRTLNRGQRRTACTKERDYCFPP